MLIQYSLYCIVCKGAPFDEKLIVIQLQSIVKIIE